MSAHTCNALRLNGVPLVAHTGQVLPGRYENEERSDVTRFLNPLSKVLEVGARFGTVSCTVNALLSDKQSQVSIEADKTVIEAFRKNRNSTNSKFHLIHGTLSSKPNKLIFAGHGIFGGTRRFRSVQSLSDSDSDIPHVTYDEIRTRYFVPDTLISDCEGAYVEFLEEFPEILDDVRMIFIEWDGGVRENVEKYKAILKAKGFREIKSGFHAVYRKVTPTPRVLFYHVPKTGGQAVTANLRRAGVLKRNMGHNFPSHLREFKHDGDITLSVVRNPFDRLYSVYQYYQRIEKSPVYHISEEVSFEEFIMNYEVHYLHKNVVHYSCYDYIADAGGKIIVDEFLRFEHIEEDYKHLCAKYDIPYYPLSRVNVNPKKALAARGTLYTPEMRAIVERVFAKDLERFGYSYDEFISETCPPPGTAGRAGRCSPTPG